VFKNSFDSDFLMKFSYTKRITFWFYWGLFQK